MGSIVKHYNGELRIGTFQISKGFAREHFDIIKLIKKHEKRFVRLENNKLISDQFIISKVTAKIAGRPVSEYLLNEAQAIFLGTLFRNSDIVLDFKEQLAREFVKTKEENYEFQKHKTTPDYKASRKLSIEVRHETTTQIEIFIKYSIEQGGSPKGCENYYSNFSRMCNVALYIWEGKYKNLRTVLSGRQLMVMSAAEGVVEKGLIDGMKNKKFYKDIYQDIKSKITMLGDMHGKSNILKGIEFKDEPIQLKYT